MFGECVYLKCNERGIARLNGKDVCQNHFETAMKAISAKKPMQPVRILENKEKLK